MLLSWATGCVSSGNFSAFDVIGSKAREFQATILLPLETRKVARGNSVLLSPKLRVRFFKKKSKIGFLNPKESENGFCVSLLNRSIRDHSNRRIHSGNGFFGLMHHDPRDLGLICLIKLRRALLNC